MSEIVFYDIPGKTEDTKAWSPSTWRTRYSLNFKGIPYRTEWVEYPEIEKVCKEIGAEPTDKSPDGKPLYTFPVIHDPSTNTILSDSTPIAEYLDKTYPDSPKLFPPGTKGFHAAFDSAFYSILARTPSLWNLVALGACTNLTPRSEAFFRDTFWRRRCDETTPIEELAGSEGSERKEQNWREVEADWVKIGTWYEASGGLFLTGGETPCYADIVLAAWLVWARQSWGKGSEDWKRLERLDGGRWGRFMKAFEKYEAVV
ncbi:hypothetical protein EIP91_005188 [Steccherinum ochraceum]|uniref:GST N-terminal domain-containing protein n=1 Tax=Steccherinum ochraceum TaxID=92696 RepID=A0A4R0RFW8_9APHY|nr:hypothetical protein EIP91_005188 [Steccherinum ochraceum]